MVSVQLSVCWVQNCYRSVWQWSRSLNRAWRRTLMRWWRPVARRSKPPTRCTSSHGKRPSVSMGTLSLMTQIHAVEAQLEAERRPTSGGGAPRHCGVDGVRTRRRNEPGNVDDDGGTKTRCSRSSTTPTRCQCHGLGGALMNTRPRALESRRSSTSPPAISSFSSVSSNFMFSEWKYCTPSFSKYKVSLTLWSLMHDFNYLCTLKFMNGHV